MDRERQKAKQMVKELPLKAKITHYWEYYKKHFFIFLISAIVIAWTVVQCVKAPVYDLNIAFYTTRAYTDESTDKFANIISEQIDEINGNGSVDVYIGKHPVDITKNTLEPQEHTVLSKVGMEMAANEYMVYVFDQPFLEYFENIYDDAVENVILLDDIPEIREILGIGDGENLYFVNVALYDRNAGNENKAEEYDNAQKAKAYFESLTSGN